MELGIPQSKIHILVEDRELFKKVMMRFVEDKVGYPRIDFIIHFADYSRKEKIAGDVAECGVFQGEFAYYINMSFPERKLYLFDTFEGFSEKDLNVERSFNDDNFIKGSFNNIIFTNGATENILRRKLPYFNRCIIRKGYFPDTATGDEGPFCFVNLDMDLYQPQLAGLNFFFDRMSPGGIILMHDYFPKELPGTKQAILDYETKIGRKLSRFPIGDRCSIAIIKDS